MKAYIEPEIEVIPIGALFALCDGSGTGTKGLGGGDLGDDPYANGRAPHRTPAF